jgi:hypothetical protein
MGGNGKDRPPLWRDLWQTGVAIVGANLAIIVAIFSILEWHVGHIAVDEARTSNQLELISFCVPYTVSKPTSFVADRNSDTNGSRTNRAPYLLVFPKSVPA